jgi:hypothetical protein
MDQCPSTCPSSPANGKHFPFASCQRQIEMSYSLPSRNVRFGGRKLRSQVKLRSMFRGSRAPWGRFEDRCDGAGSEADGAEPSVNRAIA